MLKRNGETCEHPVPGWPGLLTDSEQMAYTAAMAAYEGELRKYQDWATTLDKIEKQIPEMANLVFASTTENKRTVQGADGEWQIHQSLRKFERSEVLLCSRPTEHGAEFGVMERITAKDSLYAQARGNTDMLMTSNQPALLLQDFVENERYVLHLVREDFAASVEETLAEKFPGQDCSRVVRAISARCSTSSSAKEENPPAEKQTRRVKIHF